MNKNAECYYESAVKLFLPVKLDPIMDGFVLSMGKKNYFFYGSGTPLNNNASVQIARNKYCMNKTLERAGLPVPKAVCMSLHDFEAGKLEEMIAGLSFPLVVKPREGKFGRDVLCNIQTIEQLKAHMTESYLSNQFLTIEEFHGNLKSYRVLIFNDRILGVIFRYPAQVIGDGVHTLQELISLTNATREETSDTLGRIVVDVECKIRLKELGIDLNYQPQKGECVTLCYTSNASRGGSYKSLGKKICKQNKRLLIRGARALNLNLVGFDIQCEDITIPIETSKGVIIESNDGPSVRIHEYAIDGTPMAVCKKMLRSFIYRHPLSYMKALYTDVRTAIYVRGGIFTISCIALYELASRYY